MPDSWLRGRSCRSCSSPEEGRYIGPAPANGLDGREELPVGIVLQQVPFGAGGESLVQIRRFSVNSEDQYLQPGMVPLDPAGCLEARELRHGDVEYDHVGTRARFVQHVEEVLAVSCLAHDLEISRTRKDPLDLPPEQDVVVSQNNVIRAHVSLDSEGRRWAGRRIIR